ncbi:MAG: hypothetical protein WBB28_11390 [Crinalium sp.]
MLKSDLQTAHLGRGAEELQLKYLLACQCSQIDFWDEVWKREK